MIDSELAKLVVEGLRSISQGVEAIAKKIEDGFTDEKPATKPKRKAASKPKARSAGKRAKAKTQRTAIKKIVAKKRTPTALDTVLTIVNRSRKGIDVDTIAKKTGFDKKKISNILYKLKKAGKVKAISRGVYTKV
jgi:predicted Rossmann fold nucleotide-binding protein DprA/Smf involved in DNA uptake